MGRGFFSGVIWGSLVAILGFWLMTQVTGKVALVTEPPRQVQDEAPQDAGLTETSGETNPPEPPAETTAPATEQPAEQSAPEQEPAENAPKPEPAPVAVPEASTPPAEQPVPSEEPEPSVSVATAPPERGTVADQVLEVPDNDSPPASVETPQPTSQPVAGLDTGAEISGSDAREGAGQDVAAMAPETADERPGGAASQPARPELPVTDEAPAATDFSNPQVVVPTTPETQEEPQTETEAQAGASAGTDTDAANSEPVPDAGSKSPVPIDADEAEPEVAEVQPAPDDGETGEDEPAVSDGPAQMPVIRKAGEAVQTEKVGGFVRAGQGFNRDDTAENPEDAPEEQTDGEGDDTTATDDLPALQRYAVPFENPDARPIMAIVLLPDETAGVPEEALPFEVSFAVDANASGATEKMTALRNAGHEVVLIAPLPDRARPSDVEVAFQEYLSRVPEAVAVMDTQSANFQSSRQVSSQIAQILAETGHGMITYSHGLNSASQVAEREGVPAALVFRVFDEGNRDGAAIKRFLDQAAFRAGQQKGVVLVGHNRPKTVRALLEWSLGNRASTVALAPVSAVLLAQ